MYLFEQLVSPREFQMLSINFPTFWLILLCVLYSHSQGRKKLGSELHYEKTKGFLQLAAYSVQESSTDFRCSGKPSVVLEAMKLGWERTAFWPLCFQLERPLRKPISQQNCLYPSHLVFSSDGGLPETEERAARLPHREAWGTCVFQVNHECLPRACPEQAGDLSLEPEQGLRHRSEQGLRHRSEQPGWGEGQKLKHRELLLKHANHTPNSPPGNHSNF